MVLDTKNPPDFGSIVCVRSCSLVALAVPLWLPGLPGSEYMMTRIIVVSSMGPKQYL